MGHARSSGNESYSQFVRQRRNSVSFGSGRREWGITETVSLQAHNVAAILIFAEDITSRKKAEHAFSDMAGKLIEAHEEERTWVARELHDDVSQKLALLAVELDRGFVQCDSQAGLKECLRRAKDRIAEIATDVQALSHRLHSSKLEYLGLIVAAASFCKELSDRNNHNCPGACTRIRSLCHCVIESCNVFRPESIRFNYPMTEQLH